MVEEYNKYMGVWTRVTSSCPTMGSLSSPQLGSGECLHDIYWYVTHWPPTHARTG